MRRLWITTALAVSLLVGFVNAQAQGVPGSFLLYPNYRGMIFSDRPEILVEAPSGASVTVVDQASGGTVASAVSSGAAVRLDASTLTQDHLYTVAVVSGGATIGRWDVTPVPAGRRASMNISFDPKGQLLMHGVPRFALGVYDSGLGYSTNPADYEQKIFAPDGNRKLGDIPLNMYLNYHYGQATLPGMQALMDTLQKHGIMYLQTGNCFDAGSYTRIPFSIDQSDSYPTQFGQHAGAAGYYIMDECVDSLVPETTTHHNRLKGLDPDSMTFAATLARGYIDPRLWVESADVLGTDPYPLFGPEPAQGYTHFQVADFVAQLRNAVRGTRPIISVLQFFKFTTDSRWPTAAEQRAHAIMSIVEGAKGLFWWEVGSNGLQKSDATTVATEMANLKSLVTELAALEPALVSDDVPGSLVGNSSAYADPLAGRKAQLQYDIAVEWLYSNKTWYQAELNRLNASDTSLSPMLPGAATVRAKVKVVDGTGYVFAYNYTNKSTPVTFTWSQAPGTVKENKTGQSYPVVGSSWSDTLGAYEGRIYVVSNGGTPTPTPDPTPAPLATSFTNPASGATVSGTTTVSVTASGGKTPYTYSIDLIDGTTTPSLYKGSASTFSWNTTATANGAKSLRVTVTDSSSPAASAMASVPVTVSNAAPPPPPTPLTTSFTSPASGATVSGTATVSVAASGGTTPYTYSIDLIDGTTASNLYKGSASTFSWNTAATTNGAKSLRVTVTDWASPAASATSSIPVTVSNAAAASGPTPTPNPGFTASFTYPANGATTSGNQSIGTSTTATWGKSKTFAIYVDGKPVTSASTTATIFWYTWNSKTVSDGSHTLALAVTYKGATAVATQSIITKNGVAPAPLPVPLTASFTSPASGATVSGTSICAVTAAGGKAPYTYTMDLGDGTTTTRLYQGTANSYSWNTQAVANGAKTLRVAVTDSSSPAVSVTISLPVTVYNAPPAPAPSFTVSFSYPANGITTGGNQSIGLSTTAPWDLSKTFTIAVDGKVVTSSTSTATTFWYTWKTKTVANGTHTITATVKYNGSTATASRTVTVKN